MLAFDGQMQLQKWVSSWIQWIDRNISARWQHYEELRSNFVISKLVILVGLLNILRITSSGLTVTSERIGSQFSLIPGRRAAISIYTDNPNVSQVSTFYWPKQNHRGLPKTTLGSGSGVSWMSININIDFVDNIQICQSCRQRFMLCPFKVNLLCNRDNLGILFCTSYFMQPPSVPSLL